MMNMYALNDEAQKLAAQALRLSQDVLAQHAVDVDRQARFPKESMEALGVAGLWGLCIDRKLGGLGQGPRTFAAVVEELAGACSSTAMVYVMHVSASQAVVASKTLAGRDDILKQMAAGKHLTTLAFSEKGSRSQFWAPVSKLTPQGKNFTTNAYKSWVTSANHAQSYVSSAQKPGAVSPLESTIYLAQRPSPTIRSAALFDGSGLRGNDSAPVSIENHTVELGHLISEQGEGAKMMLEVVLPWFSVGVSAMACGLCRGAIASTTKHLVESGFEHTGTKLRDLPNLRARLAEMSVATEGARALLAYTIGLLEKPTEMTPLYVLQSRMLATQAADKVTDLAMKTCGGAAFSRQNDVERMFRDARAGWVMAPTMDHLQDFIGKALTGLPLF